MREYEKAKELYSVTISFIQQNFPKKGNGYELSICFVNLHQIFCDLNELYSAGGNIISIFSSNFILFDENLFSLTLICSFFWCIANNIFRLHQRKFHSTESL